MVGGWQQHLIWSTCFGAEFSQGRHILVQSFVPGRHILLLRFGADYYQKLSEIFLISSLVTCHPPIII